MQTQAAEDDDQIEDSDEMHEGYDSGNEAMAEHADQLFSPILGAHPASFEEERLVSAAMPFEVSFWS